MTLAENNVLNEIVVASDGVEALARPYSGPACRLLMLYHGLAPKGLTSELNQRLNWLNSRLHQALAPCEQALLAMGLDVPAAQRENTALFAHGVGLLLLQHTGRIRMFKQDATDLFDHYMDALLLRAPLTAGGHANAARCR